MQEETRIGVDIGGTFTDIVSIRNGTISVAKTPSTPATPETGVVDGLTDPSSAAIDPTTATFFAHGTTVATNAVLEKDWSETALITTDGFRDALEIGRQNRPALYDFNAEKPAPIVPRDHRYEVPERLDERGHVETPLDEQAVQNLIENLSNVDSIAVSLLFSFENADHEHQIKDLLETSDLDAHISISSNVLPEIREYERTLATALNAALSPVMDEYLGALESHLTELDVPAGLRIMQSNGGIITADVARDRPINTLLSGPAAGVQGAAFIAGHAGMDRVITMDMGGTSCDVSLVRDGDPLISTEVEVGEYPVGVPMIDVHTIGAGGGSIAYLDAGGALRVGPRSAGADPGPICYGRGGTDPTVTDAHLLLGRIDPEAFGYDFDVDRSAVESAVTNQIGAPLGMDVEEAAQGILDVATANMERALRVVSVERGHDPREFGLVAFGGAGPLHACRLARELDIPQVLIPRTAGVLSALGLLISDVVYDYSTSRVREWSTVDPEELDDEFEQFTARGDDRLAAEGISAAQREFERSVDVRYAGQSFDLTVEVPETITAATMDDIAARFHEYHEQRYGHASPGEPIELVTIRLRARGVVEEPDLAQDTAGGSLEEARRHERRVMYDGEPYATPVYRQAALPVNAEFDGPAVIEGAESTVVVHPDQHARVDQFGNLRVEV